MVVPPFQPLYSSPGEMIIPTYSRVLSVMQGEYDIMEVRVTRRSCFKIEAKQGSQFGLVSTRVQPVRKAELVHVNNLLL